MENWFFNLENGLNVNRGESGFFFNDKSEYDENSSMFNINNQPPLINNDSNDNSDSPNIPIFKVNEDNENILKYNKIEAITNLMVLCSRGSTGFNTY